MSDQSADLLVLLNLGSLELEAYLRAAHKLEVMVGAVVEVDFVTGFQAKSDEAGIEFNTAAWVEHAIGITSGNSVDLGNYVARSHSIVHSKIQQTAFEDGKHPDGASSLKFWAEKTVNQAQIGTYCSGIVAQVSDGCGLVTFEVVGHLAFEHHMRMNIDSQACSDSEHVGAGML